MERFLDSDLELVLRSGFLYFPLLFDPAVENELSSARGGELAAAGSGSGGDTVLEVGGRHYLKTMRLPALVEACRNLGRNSALHLRRTLLDRYGVLPCLKVDGKLPVILFQILPHFVRTRKAPSRHGARQADILAFLRSRISVPPAYLEAAARFVETEPLQRLIRELEDGAGGLVPPEDGLLRGRDLRAWLLRAVELEMMRADKGRLEDGLGQCERFRRTSKDHLATILFLADQTSFEVDGFGFLRGGESEDYVIYKRSGEYALRDYYGRLYLFPDCRVAVSTRGRLRPFVLDRYKHPFLFGHEAGQEICLREFTASNEFSAGNVIFALEQGLAALYSGYNPRLRNGYHSLDPLTQMRRSLDFADYRIPPDRPDIVSGKVEVTNART
jgi:hypothetical protein